MNLENHEINGETLKYYRNDRGYSQEELATKVGVTTNTVSRWEIGKNNITQKHQKRLENELGVPLKLLRKPLPVHKKRTPEKLDQRTNSTISEKSKVALDIVSETYHVNRNAIMDIAPFMFHVFAAASLGRRATKLDEMNKELEKVRQICLEKLPYIPSGVFIEDSMDGGSLFYEQEAINDNRLFFSDDISDDINDISTNPFSQFLKSFIDLMPEELSEIFEVEWRNDELPRYHITYSYIRHILGIPVDEDLLEQIMELVLNGVMQVKEINYISLLTGLGDEFVEKHEERLVKEIKELVTEKYLAYQSSRQPD